MYLPPFVVLCLFIMLFPKAIPDLFKDCVGLVGFFFNLFVKTLTFINYVVTKVSNSKLLDQFRMICAILLVLVLSSIVLLALYVVIKGLLF